MLARWIVGVVLTAVGIALQQPPRPQPYGDLGADAGQGAPLFHAATDPAAPGGGLAEYPAVDIPPAYRVHNWRGPNGSGSCVHASMVMLFNWQGRPDLADWWKANYHSGETSSRLATKLEANGVRWAGVVNGDAGFCDWALRTRRGCAVTVQGGAHMVCLVHLDETRAGILDNNAPGRIRWTSRDAFLSEWRNASGWAVTPVYDPPPRLPFVAEVLL